ncbi:zf-HC2 domain-containing protein [Nocardia sp. NPDC051990]|uniref:anti-sigma factor family protein n=1 Tax=Nocardia sp. NPDC051990 TaxID=3155285 RepID=UPI003430436F
MTDQSAHERYRLMLGAYILGGLTTSERVAVDLHADDCPTCRGELAEFAVIPGLLTAAPESVIAQTSATSAPTGFPAALQSITATRSSRRRWMAGAILGTAAVALIAGIGIGTAVVDRPAAPSADHVVALTADSGTTRGEADLAARPWGTELRLDLTRLPRGQRLVAVAIDADGRAEPAATWVVPEMDEIRVTGAVAIPTNAVRRIEIRRGNETVLTGSVGR